jgi:deoxyribodipyrimidine photo-lyase
MREDRKSELRASRDASGCAGIAWCFGKHDRPWTGRPLYGTVRFMNSGGLKRKFDADLYVYRMRRMKEDRCSTISSTPR